MTTDTLFDCAGCTFPSSLKHLWLNVGLMQEDGCFDQTSGSLKNLQTMQVSFRVNGSTFNLRSFLCTAGAIDIKVNQDRDSAILEISMPPDDDDVWLELL